MNYDDLYEDECRYVLQSKDADSIKSYFIKKRGWVYVAQSTDNSLLKVGRTSKNPMERAKTLSSTGVLNDYTIVFSLKFFNQFWAEKTIHKCLKAYNVRKEFFSTTEEIVFEQIYKTLEKETELLQRFLNVDLIRDDLELMSYALKK